MVRLLRHPTLRSATQATFVQRGVAFTAMVLLVSVVLFWPSIRDHAGQAFAQVQDNNYQPFNCGQANSTNPQQRRQNLALNSGSGGTANGHAYPCVSGVQWTLKLGDPNASLNDTNGVVGVIQNAFATSGETLYFAANGSAPVVQVSVQSLQFCSGNNVPPDNVNGYRCTHATSGIQLYANSQTSGSYQPTTPYQLNITPSGPILVGGSGMMADIFGVPSSTIQVATAAVPSGSTGCGFVGGSTHGQGCTLSLSQFSGSLAQALAGGSTFPLSAINLSFYYLITHTPTTTNPYNPLEVTGNSVQLPNTRIFVGNGS